MVTVEVCEDWKKANATDILNTDKKVNQRTTDWSALPQALERGHTRYDLLASSKPARMTSQVGRWVPLVPTGESPTTNTHNFLLVQICVSDSASSKDFSYMAFFSAATMAKRRQENTCLQPPQGHLISYYTQP